MIKYLENSKNFENLTKKRCLVDFYADWCGPCRMLGEVLEEYSKEKDSLDIIKINTDEYNDIAFSFGVMSIPALFIMEESIEIKKHVGYMTLDELKKFTEEK